MDFRTLRVYFEVADNTEFSVEVENNPVEVADNYFSFQTATDFHGSYSVAINVTSGSMTLERCTATYPANINGKSGSVTMLQPIRDPVAVISQGSIQAMPFPIVIVEKFCYQHLMFNGPNRFDITSRELYRNLYLGNVLEGDLNPDIEHIEPVYHYDPQPNDLFKKSDLEMLRTTVLNKKS